MGAFIHSIIGGKCATRAFVLFLMGAWVQTFFIFCLVTGAYTSGENPRSNAPAHTARGPIAYVQDHSATVVLGVLGSLVLSVTAGALAIRRVSGAAKRLLETTRKLAVRNPKSSPESESIDEFERIEGYARALHSRVEKLTKVLKLLSDLDHAILERTSVEPSKSTFLEALPDCLGIEAAAIAVSDPASGRVSRAYVLTKNSVKITRVPSQGHALQTAEKTLTPDFLRKRIEELGLLESWAAEHLGRANFLPIQTREGLSGMFIYARPSSPGWDLSDDTNMAAIARRIGVSVAATQKEQQLFLQTRFDHLTHLPNRLLFSDRVVHEIARANRNGNMMALLYVDLDYFKQINDSLGHSAGDHVLRTVASRLRTSIRESDTVARLSGDEFAVILSDLTHIRDAGLLARNIIQKLSEPFTIETQQCFLCASIGIAIYPTDGQQPELLLRNADIAMYRAKEAGKGRYVFYEERMNLETHQLANLDRELRLALERNEFELHFQPQIELRTGNICGVEALLRWRHPERGLLSPAYFMAHAESSGLIEPLGELVLVKACEHYNRWREQGIAPARMCINASPRQFKRPNFYRFVENTLKAAGIAPKHLEVEVTESVFMEENELSRVNINKLAALGVRIAIDDFGTGYSSLAYLKRLPFHLLKIDRSFVRDLSTDEDARTIASTIIAMAHSLRKEVLAEGVDHIDQLEFLRREHCEQVQGYLVSQPLPDNEFVQFLREYLPTRFGTRDFHLLDSENSVEMSSSYLGPQ